METQSNNEPIKQKLKFRITEVTSKRETYVYINLLITFNIN